MIKIILIGLLLLGGCASAHNPADPFEPVNRSIYSFNDKLDKTVVKPVAKEYVKIVPNTGRIMISNFFSNLDDAKTAINDVLQFKLVQGFSDGMRFVVNTTVGVFGLVDVASKGGLEKHNEDFGQTLAHWGVNSGPYIVIPILGPSTVRDGIGRYADSTVDIISTDVPTRNEMFVVEGISKRSGLLDAESIANEATVDPYAFRRDTYLLYRKNLSYDGHPPKINYDDE